MPQKVIDIISLDSRFNNARENVLNPTGKKPKQSGPQRFWTKFLIILMLLIFLGLGAFAGLTLQSRLTLNLTLYDQVTEISEPISIDTSISSSNYEKRIVKGEVLEVSKVLEQKFAVSGASSEGARARGVIRVYNKKNPPAPVKFVVKTRFLSASEKTLKALTTVEVPAATIEGGKVVPGFKDIQVEAQEAGEEYNIGPSKFSLPGLVGHPSYYDIWGESTAKMAGGTLKAVKKVTTDDLDAARKSLSAVLETETKKQLEEQAQGNYLLEEKALLIGAPEITCRQQEGDQAEELVCSGKIAGKGLAAKISELKDFAYRVISDQLGSTTNFRMETVELSLIPQEINFDNNYIEGDLAITAKTYQALDREDFSKRILGRAEAEIRDLMTSNYPQIKKADFIFWPFWAKSCPQNANRLELGFQFDE